MRDEDTSIVTAVQAGDTEAYRVLVERHKGRLTAMICKIIGDRAVAEELAQDTFVKAFQAINGFRQEARFGTWLVQIGIHTARDHLRRVQHLRQQQVISLEALRENQRQDLEPVDHHAWSNPHSGLDSEEADEVMQEALASLPGEYREVLVLKHFEGWPFERIAQLTGATVGTLKVRAHRARRLLKTELVSRGWQFESRHDSFRSSGSGHSSQPGEQP